MSVQLNSETHLPLVQAERGHWHSVKQLFSSDTAHRARVASVDQLVKVWLDQNLDFLLHGWLARIPVDLMAVLIMLFDHCHEDRVPDFNTIFFVELLIVMVDRGRDILWQDERKVDGVDPWLQVFVTLELITNPVIINELVDVESFSLLVVGVLRILVESFLVSFHFETDAAHFHLFFDCEIYLSSH